MTLFGKYLNLTAVAVIGLTLTVRGADTPPKHIDLKPFQNVEDVVVPLPNEIFSALNKLGAVNWKEHVRSDKGGNFMERPRVALLLGTVIADGFIAVQAQDAPTVKDIGQRVLALAKQIGVGSSITPHAKAIIDGADKRKWDNVRRELDSTQNSVQQAMNELQDQKLSELVSLGGWLRGTEVLTSVVSKQFSHDGAELLHQPDLVAHFQDQLRLMPDKYNVEIVRQIHSGLGDVKPLLDVQGHISAEAVKKINEIATRLDHGIVTKD
jgi:hypothetical protein